LINLLKGGKVVDKGRGVLWRHAFVSVIKENSWEKVTSASQGPHDPNLIRTMQEEG